MKKLMGVEKVDGRTERTWKHFNADGKPVFTIQTTEDVEPLIDSNKRAYNDAPERFGKGDFHKVASIPVTVIEATCRNKQIPYREFISGKTDRAIKAWNELLNSPDLRYFRTRPGQVTVK